MSNTPFTANRKCLQKGFTIVELLVVVSIIALLIALLLPAVAKGRDKALISQSVSNLKNLAASNETYAGDWNDRQFTTCPDDAGLANGNCNTYLSQIACPPQQFIGWDGAGIWGYFLGSSGKCSQYGWPEACYNWIVYIPIQFGTAGNPGGGNAFGSFRMPSTKAFHDYVNGKFYDQTFYAPKDLVPLANISKYFTSPSEFTYDGTAYEDSSYCFSPAAMWDPKVMARNGATLNGSGFTQPGTLPAAFRSPPVSRCKYPSLKTRMIEHNWLQNAPDSPINTNFAGGKTPWFFNHGYNSAPACLFFDGHIELVGCQRAQQAEQRAGKLWSRNTPLGTGGYYGNQSYDFLVDTSMHILTTDGIEGRDVLGAEG
ncbi:MAG: prepilin-type N-terminal cleavage/methylation domain-containing protein [Phycisphaerales bacterium]